MQYILRALRNISGRPMGRFPGAHPVTFTRKRLPFIQRHAYMVTEKTDGTRYLLYVNKKSGVFLIDRKLQFVACNIRGNLPRETILDGEMIFENGVYVFYAFDALCYDRINVTQLPLQDRLRTIHQFIRRVQNPLFKLKAFYKVQHTYQLLTDIMPKLLHPSDGLIFTPCLDAYEPQKPILKWKPSSLNSVDFLIRGGKCYVNDRKEPVAEIEETRELVGECVWRGRWVLERVREDKRAGNSFKVYQDIVNDLKNPLTARELCSFIAHRINTL